MRRQISLWLPLLALLACSSVILGQGKPHPGKIAGSEAKSHTPDDREKNLQAYIELLHTNVRQEKAQLMGDIMQLDVDDAAKFWPLYSEYDAELTKLDKLRGETIKEYGRTYSGLTDAKADELINRELDYLKQRMELLNRYYERVKQALGAITASRFIQVEHQLLLIIDLQMDSSLPIKAQS
jgi:hypothetical protein